MTPRLPPQPAPDLEPLHFLQCHSKNNSPRDLDTQLWACAFEPAWEEGTALAGQAGPGREPQGTPLEGAASADGGPGRDSL